MIHDTGVLADELARQLADQLQPRGAYDVRSAAQWLSLSPRTVEMLIATGDLASFTVGKRRLVARQALDEFVALRAAGVGDDVVAT